MDRIDQYVKAAKEQGFPSYGLYVASLYNPQQASPSPTKKRRRPQRPRKFTDKQAFTLWQKHMTDSEIGAALGVSRAYIQRWRDQLELPSTSKTCIDTKKYRLAALQDGTSIVLTSE